jgi:nitronate monooxygenase
MAVGAFYEKGMAIRDWHARLEFLNRGQAWVARRIAAALPRIADELGRKVLQTMHQSHLDNIALCKEKLG